MSSLGLSSPPLSGLLEVSAAGFSAVSPESFLLFALEYRSEYQPPPFSTNDVWEIRRWTFLALHLGQVRTGFSVMRCSRSNS